MRRATILAALLALALPASGGAQMHMDHGGAGGPAVDVQFGAFAPAALDVLTGDRITWTNASARRHDVAADDLSFDSGSLFTGGVYERAFDHPGVVPYYCTLHPFMRGTVTVHDLLLTAPSEPAAPGRPFAVRGRAALPAGTPIAIEADTGAGFAKLADASAGDDGGFTATLKPTAGGQLRAVAAGAEASPPVQLLVLDRKVSAALHHGRIHATVTPASHGGKVVLQMFLREHFGWWPVKTRTLDHHSMASFRVHPRRAVRARVVLTLADGATPIAVSPTLRLRPARSHGR
jgi:plastocyanin